MIQLTTREEVEARQGRALTPTEDAIFDALVRDITAFLYAAAPRIPRQLPLPDAVIGVASRLAITGLEQSTGAVTTGISSESLGGYSISYANSGGGGSDQPSGLSLTDVMVTSLRPWMSGRISSVSIDPTTVVVH